MTTTRVDRVALNCPKCQEPITRKQVAAAMGAITSQAKRATSRENGKKGGRPPKGENQASQQLE